MAIFQFRLDHYRGSYEFAGNQKLAFNVSLDRDTEVLEVTVNTAAELEPQVELAIAVFQEFHLRKH